MGPDSIGNAEKSFKKILLVIPKYKNVQTVICPPFLYIPKLVELAKKKPIIGAQNLFEEEKGSFTGEISALMLKALGVRYVIIGHSEQRKLGESDQSINKKILIALKTGITPIICIGEETRDDDGEYLAVLKNQLAGALNSVTKKMLDTVIIAYEPVWAIGGAQAMKSGEVHETVLFTKKALIDMYKVKPASIVTPILYGGSVDPENCASIMTEGEADGLLIGRQSLIPENFTAVIRIANTLKK